MKDKNSTILIVDDDPAFLEAKAKRLKSEGYTIDTTTSPREAITKITNEEYDLVLTDLRMDEMSGIDLLKKIKEISPETEAIMISGFTDTETVIEAIKSGAYDYIAKTSPYDEILLRIARALERKTDIEEIHKLRDALRERYSFKNIIGKNQKMQEVYTLIETVCNTDVSVLIRGETGTGKELVARAIHFNSTRKDKPFIVVNCAAISENLIESELFGHVKGAFTGAIEDRPGKLELADGGTVFLDEIGDLSINLQAKLLRVLQDKKFERVGGTKMLSTDARILSATNRNLEVLMNEARFREDLFYRINVVTINIPPLRERIDDIKILLNHFLDISNREFNKKIEGFTNDALSILSNYSWPGNVRELENLIKKLALTIKGRKITGEDVINNLKGTGTPKTAVPTELPWKEMMDKTEREYFQSLLKRFNGRLTMVCKNARIHRRTLYKKMKIFNLRREDFLQRGKEE